MLESETLCCWKQQYFALLLLQKQNDGGTYSLIADPELLIDPLLFLLLSIWIAVDTAAGMFLRGAAIAAAVSLPLLGSIVRKIMVNPLIDCLVMMVILLIDPLLFFCCYC